MSAHRVTELTIKRFQSQAKHFSEVNFVGCRELTKKKCIGNYDRNIRAPIRFFPQSWLQMRGAYLIHKKLSGPRPLYLPQC